MHASPGATRRPEVTATKTAAAAKTATPPSDCRCQDHQPVLRDARPHSRDQLPERAGRCGEPDLERCLLAADRDVAPGHFDFTALDALVAASAAGHAKPLLMLGQTPSFASTKPRAANVVATVPRMALLEEVRRHGRRQIQGRLLDYEIWPEPSISRNWAGTPQQLARSWLRPRPSSTGRLAAPSWSGRRWCMRLKFEQKFMDRFYATKVGGKPVGRSVDAVGIDAYPAAARHARGLGGPDRHRPQDPGCAQGQGSPVERRDHLRGRRRAHHRPPASGGTQASYVARTFLLNAASGVKRVYWLGWAPIAEVGVQLVQPDLVTPTTAGTGLRHGAELDDGAERALVCARPALTSLRLQDGRVTESTTWVYWTTAGKATVKAPRAHITSSDFCRAPSGTHAGARITVTSTPVRVYH